MQGKDRQQDSGCESDDDAHMGDDPEQRAQNSNGTTDQALRSCWEHDLPPGNACRAMAALRALRRVGGAFVTGDELRVSARRGGLKRAWASRVCQCQVKGLSVFRGGSWKEAVQWR